MSSTTSRRAARCSSRPSARRRRARRSSSPRTGSRPRCTRTLRRSATTTIDATCPLVTKVHVQARRFAAEGYTVILIGHAGHEEVVGTMGEAPESIVLVESVADAEALTCRTTRGSPTSRRRRSRWTRRARSSRALRRRFPDDPRAEEGRHLLRDLQPAVGREGDARGDRPPARDRLAQLLQLEPPRRRRARRRRPVAPDRRRVRDRRGVARRRRDGRHHLGRLRAGEARAAGLRLVPRARRRARSSRSGWSTRT